MMLHAIINAVPHNNNSFYNTKCCMVCLFLKKCIVALSLTKSVDNFRDSTLSSVYGCIFAIFVFDFIFTRLTNTMNSVAHN